MQRDLHYAAAGSRKTGHLSLRAVQRDWVSLRRVIPVGKPQHTEIPGDLHRFYVIGQRL